MQINSGETIIGNRYAVHLHILLPTCWNKSSK